ncbi:hypothetical protein [Alkalihalobacillus deserti]|uniref:hypothetical protein n=1 Tax=Alkalihalobacillus deserti TaxID=2879466 RepID=UPI001D133AA9|nr:hypothetical protein [Alkalihalobacillus deserti]
MIIVCTKHVKEGLKVIHLPHIHLISNQEKRFGNDKCQICNQKADYKLFNYFPQMEQRLKTVI